jgi:thiamine biosynthesis protein ThiS
VIFIGERDIPWTPGMTVADVMRNQRKADLGFVLEVDGKVVWQKDWELTHLADGSRLRIRPLMVGG